MVDWESFYGAFRQPDFVSGYEIQNHLGGGAFGEVYKARKTSIGKPYAIKFLRLDQDSNRDAIERELEQVRLFASIDHPNLVTIEDMGVVQGVPYLVMGYAGEETLARRLKRADLDRPSAMRYFVQACRGVLALHDRRLAHFDLKPGNVFIKGDVARVGDYGLAKLLTEGRQTLSFGRGTPHYMAPEMLKNRADHRADVYSLGVILYESLAGNLPYGGSEAQVGVVVREDDAPPSFPADFPADIRPVVERCLRLEPDDRFDSVHGLLEGLGQTARQGDSVVVPWDGARAGAPRGVETDDRGAGTREGESELRVAAAELARGAVGVARGVWDGVVERVSSSREEEGSDELPGSTLGGEVVSVQSLTAENRAESVAAAGALVPRASGGAAVEAGGGPRFALSAPYGSGPAGAGSTVPVPPRAEGGWLGTIFASVALGAEILGALITGPVLVVLRGAGGAVDRLLRGVPGFLGGLLRFVFFLVVLALVGALAAFVVLAGASIQ